MTYAILVTCPRHMEYLLTDELTALGLSVTKTTPNDVYGDASLKMIYTICVWSRLANRVQVILFDGDVTDVKSMYDFCALYPWRDVFTADKSFAIDFNGTSSFITNTMYGAQVIKDAVNSAKYAIEHSYFRPWYFPVG